MMTEPSGFADRLAQRTESARQTLRAASSEELQGLVTELFPDGTHPFAEAFSKFIQENHSEHAVRGKTSDGVEFVYYPRPNRGMWFILGGTAPSVGLLGTTALKALSEITAQTGR